MKKSLRARFALFVLFSVSVTFSPIHADAVEEFSNEEVLVRFSGNTTPDAALEQLHNIEDVEQLTPQSDEAPAGLPEEVTNVYAVTPESNESVDELIDSLNADPRVDVAEQNPLYSLTKTPNDALLSTLWGLENDGTGGTEDADIDATNAWDVQTDAADVVVAVIDTGIDYTHEDLTQNMWKNPGEIADDGIDNDGNGYIDDVYGYDFFNGDSNPYDDHSHGTHVAGTIGAIGNNGIGVTGVTWDVQLAALKVCGTEYCSGSAIIEAIAYAATMGIPISNNSYGGGGYSAIVEAAIDEAGKNANHLYVAAAGNNASDNDENPFYPASYDSDYILSVASTTRSDVLSYFSNYGKTSVDIAAPGSSIRSTTPNDSYGYKSGTSMAAPHATGSAALLLGNDDTLTPLQLRSRLINNGDQIDSLAGKTLSDSRLNIDNALASLTENTPPTAVISSDNASPTTEDIINFDASASSDPDGDRLTFQWNFGNGESAGPTSTPTAAFRFAIPGTYAVTVTVSDELFEDIATITLQVAPPSGSVSENNSGEKDADDGTSNPEGVMIDQLVWEKRPKKSGWRIRWKATEDAKINAQLIRKKKKKTVVLKKWNRKGKKALPAYKVRNYLKNNPKQFRKRKQLRVRLVVTSQENTSLRARKSSRVPQHRYKRWNKKYGN
jgi:subtilisin family serine protease